MFNFFFGSVSKKLIHFLIKKVLRVIFLHTFDKILIKVELIKDF